MLRTREQGLSAVVQIVDNDTNMMRIVIQAVRDTEAGETLAKRVQEALEAKGIEVTPGEVKKGATQVTGQFVPSPDAGYGSGPGGYHEKDTVPTIEIPMIVNMDTVMDRLLPSEQAKQLKDMSRSRRK